MSGLQTPLYGDPAGPVAGVDEAGRGPLAGPVVAAAVILDAARPIDGLADSKTLSAARRGSLDCAIRTSARAWAISSLARISSSSSASFSLSNSISRSTRSF